MYIIKVCGCNKTPIVTKDVFGSKKYKANEHTPVLIFERDLIEEDVSIYLSVFNVDKYFRWCYIYEKGARVPLIYYSDSKTKQK